MSETSFKRVSSIYKNHSERFIVKMIDYSKQYCTIYRVRLSKMREILMPRIAQKWADQYPICDIHKLSENNYVKCIIIGTLFKDQKLKPSILKQLAEANSLVPQPVYNHFTDKSDSLFIEDQLQRYALLGDISLYNIVTGVSCAILGKPVDDGSFQVEDYCFSGFQTQIERPIFTDDKFVILLSGIDIAHFENITYPLRQFLNWLSGYYLTTAIDIRKIIRLIIVGNCISTVPPVTEEQISLLSQAPLPSDTKDSVGLMDIILHEFVQLLDVDLMPGEFDPSNHILPQQPMHQCLFSNAKYFKSFNRVSNPYDCEVDEIRLIGNSGQPISSILAYSDITEPIEALEQCLKWSHLAPTAPDTLGCHPFSENDPFIITECPHVFFTGNQEKFATKICQGEDGQQVRLICIPTFSQSFQVAILNLKTLDCYPFLFEAMDVC